MLVLGLVACDRSIGVTIENRMSSEVAIYETDKPDEKPYLRLAPGQEKTLAFGKGDARVVARDSTGSIVFNQVVPWAELKRSGRIAIE
jgi:hypothetical protein